MKEILFEPVEEQNVWLTSVPTPVCLCKTFLCKACPGIERVNKRQKYKGPVFSQQPGTKSASRPADKLDLVSRPMMILFCLLFSQTFLACKGFIGDVSLFEQQGKKSALVKRINRGCTVNETVVNR